MFFTRTLAPVNEYSQDYQHKADYKNYIEAILLAELAL